MFNARAEVSTDRPARYAKQLVSHLGRHTPPVEEGEGHRLIFGSGTCLVEARETDLLLLATAETAEQLDQVQDVVARHLIRFGEKDELTVTWAADQE